MSDACPYRIRGLIPAFAVGYVLAAAVVSSQLMDAPPSLQRPLAWFLASMILLTFVLFCAAMIDHCTPSSDSHVVARYILACFFAVGIWMQVAGALCIGFDDPCTTVLPFLAAVNCIGVIQWSNGSLRSSHAAVVSMAAAGPVAFLVAEGLLNGVPVSPQRALGLWLSGPLIAAVSALIGSRAGIALLLCGLVAFVVESSTRSCLPLAIALGLAVGALGWLLADGG